jgi:hypothetical protein
MTDAYQHLLSSQANQMMMLHHAPRTGRVLAAIESNLIQAVLALRIARGHGDIVEEAEAHGRVAQGVMAGRPDQAEGPRRPPRRRLRPLRRRVHERQRRPNSLIRKQVNYTLITPAYAFAEGLRRTKV